MYHNFHQLSLQKLIDLLAEETQKYTKAIRTSNSKEVDLQRSKIDFLVEEINSRKQGSSMQDMTQIHPQRES